MCSFCPDGGTFTKKTDKPVSIRRNRISTVSPKTPATATSEAPSVR
ncbi:MAG: hypothetical protein J6W82_06650 [Bacteroidales bacterium]|nr:hypothetical protein [Bacteroidales bacterium]